MASELYTATVLDLEKLREGFWNGHYLVPPQSALIILGALLLGAGLWSLCTVCMHQWRRSEGLRLFNRIAAESGLSMRQRWQLWRLARSRGLTTPLTLLVCEATLSAQAAVASKRLSPEAAERLAQSVALISRKLFG